MIKFIVSNVKQVVVVQMSNKQSRLGINEQGNRKKIIQLTLQGEIIKTFLSISEAAKEVDAPIQSISKVLVGKRKKTRGFRWEYV